MAAATATASSNSVGVPKAIPPDKINLRLILVSGKIHEFLFSPNASASEIAQYVFDNWPEEWSEDKVQNANILKLIYHGRFLHGNVTLGALSLPLQKTTTMHLVARESLPEPNSQDNLKKSKSGSCCRCCTVMWLGRQHFATRQEKRTLALDFCTLNLDIFSKLLIPNKILCDTKMPGHRCRRQWRGVCFIWKT